MYKRVASDRKTCLNSRFQSPVYSFFTNVDLSDFDFDSAINAMSLVSALILTVPFGVAGNFDSSFWETFQEQIDICSTGEWNTSGTYEFYYEKVRTYLSGSLYASLYTLTFGTCYYLFKPRSLLELSKWSKLKLRLLLFLIFFSTICSVIFMFNLFNIFLNILIVNNSSCGHTQSFMITLPGGFMFSFVIIIAIYLLW